MELRKIIKSKLKEYKDKAKASVSESASNIKDKSKEYADKAKDETVNLKNKAEDTIKKYPLSSTAAAGAGSLIADDLIEDDVIAEDDFEEILKALQDKRDNGQRLTYEEQELLDMFSED